MMEFRQAGVEARAGAGRKRSAKTRRITTAPMAGTCQMPCQSWPPSGKDEVLHHAPGGPGADQVADALGEERQEPLRGGADLRARLLVGVDLAGHEEEVVADAVQQDAGVEHPEPRPGVAVGEEEVPDRPRQHADQEDAAHAPPREEPREQQHEADLGHLAEGHLAGRLGHPDLVEVQVGEGVVELERDAEEERADHEGGEGAVLEQRQRVEAQDVAHAERLAGGVGRRVRQQKAEEPEHHGGAGGQLHRRGGGLESHPPDHQARDDPPDGAEHADGGEFLARVAYVVERDASW